MAQISLKERLITYPESEVLEKLKSTGMVSNGLTSVRFIVPFCMGYGISKGVGCCLLFCR